MQSEHALGRLNAPPAERPGAPRGDGTAHRIVAVDRGASLAVVLAAPRLRARQVEGIERMRLPGGLLIPVLAALICVGLLVQVDLDTVWRTAVYLAIGSVLYLFARAAARRARR